MQWTGFFWVGRLECDVKDVLLFFYEYEKRVGKGMGGDNFFEAEGNAEEEEQKKIV